MKTAGYSGTPLAKKLGIKENFSIKLINTPEYYFDLFTDFPKGINVATTKKSNIDFIHYFSENQAKLSQELPRLKKQLVPNGMIWVSWYKKSAKIQTDITEDTVRHLALRNGLVDVKVCAIDEVWSGLKLVIPVKDRKAINQ
jgi:hypothetical protein